VVKHLGVASWHRCRRFWRENLQCPFHGIEPEEEEEEDDDEPQDVRLEFVPEKNPFTNNELEVAPTPTPQTFEDAVPVTAGVKRGKDLLERNFEEELQIPDPDPDLLVIKDIPLNIPEGDVEGIPNIPGSRQAVDVPNKLGVAAENFASYFFGGSAIAQVAESPRSVEATQASFLGLPNCSWVCLLLMRLPIFGRPTIRTLGFVILDL